jgi:hypothetical protein
MAATRAFVARRMAGNLRGTRQLTTTVNKRKKKALISIHFLTLITCIMLARYSDMHLLHLHSRLNLSMAELNVWNELGGKREL